MLQHNPHSHTIQCALTFSVLDAHETRELDPVQARQAPCAGCRCRLMRVEPAKPKREK